jgi:hypothetical protein
VTYFEGHNGLGTQHYNLVAPTGGSAQYREIKCDGVAELLAEPREQDVRLDLLVRLEFTDAQGARWSRESSGNLVRA